MEVCTVVKRFHRTPCLSLNNEYTHFSTDSNISTAPQRAPHVTLDPSRFQLSAVMVYRYGISLGWFSSHEDFRGLQLNTRNLSINTMA
jgi:hypothetical protein